MKLTNVVDKDVADVMCQADLEKIIFWLRNPPVMVRPPWLHWCLGDFEKNGEIAERSEGRREVGLLMGDAPFACLLMSDSLVGHYDQQQESSWMLFKPINDYWPFIVLKVKKVQRILQQPRLDRVGKWSFFLDWRHRDLLFRYHLWKNDEQWSWDGHLVVVVMECWICGGGLLGQKQQVSFSDFWATILPANGQMTQE